MSPELELVHTCQLSALIARWGAAKWTEKRLCEWSLIVGISMFYLILWLNHVSPVCKQIQAIKSRAKSKNVYLVYI